jgi:uncharacterized protein YkwD
MIIAKMLLCASVLMLGTPQATEPMPLPKTEAKAEQKTTKAEQKTDKAEQKTNKAERKAESKPAASPESEVKVIDGVKLISIEANIVSFTNKERVRHGLPPLEVDKELMGTAREHAQWMTNNQSMVHTSRPVAENIAMGQPDSSEVVQAWMNSSGHRANILNPGHRRIGVAAFRTASGVIYWCQQFRR